MNEQMFVCLFNHGGGVGSAAIHTACRDLGLVFKIVPRLNALAGPIGLCHCDRILWPKITAGPGEVRVLMKRDGIPPPHETRKDTNGGHVLHLIPPPQSLSVEEWKLILAAVADEGALDQLLAGEDTGGVRKYFFPAPQSHLIALAILCQGYLAARKCFDLIFPSGEQPAVTVAIPAAAEETVKKASWWRQPFDLPKLKQQVLQECLGKIPPKVEAIVNVLVDVKAYDGNSQIEDAALVCDALHEIQSILER